MKKWEPGIETIEEKRLIGKHMFMSIAENATAALWQSFMPCRKEIAAKNSNLFSVQLYPANYFDAFDPNVPFEKWSAVEVNSFESLPTGMDALIIPAGLYAIFSYKGLSTDPSVFNYIFTEWLPQSTYRLDHRPHFELLGEKYKNGDPNSEEKIFIPIKQN